MTKRGSRSFSLKMKREPAVREGGCTSEKRGGGREQRPAENGRHRRARRVARAQPRSPQHLSKKIFSTGSQSEERAANDGHPESRPNQEFSSPLSGVVLAEEDGVDADCRRRRERERREEPPLFRIPDEGKRPTADAVTREESSEGEERRAGSQRERGAAPPVTPARPPRRGAARRPSARSSK